MGLVDDIRSWSRKQGAPVTMGLIATMILANLIFFFAKYQGIEFVGFIAPNLKYPWTLVTYPWASMMFDGWRLVWFVFLMYWIVWTGTSVERQTGTVKFLIAWFVWTIVGGLTVQLGATMFTSKGGAPLLGPEIPVSALTVAWCTRNPKATIMLCGILPMTGMWLGWLTVGSVFFGFGLPSPLVGLCAAIPLGLAYLFASDRLPFFPFGGQARVIKVNEKEATTRGQVKYDQSYFDEVKRREKEREDRASFDGPRGRIDSLSDVT